MPGGNPVLRLSVVAKAAHNAFLKNCGCNPTGFQVIYQTTVPRSILKFGTNVTRPYGPNIHWFGKPNLHKLSEYSEQFKRPHPSGCWKTIWSQAHIPALLTAWTTPAKAAAWLFRMHGKQVLTRLAARADKNVIGSLPENRAIKTAPLPGH